MLMPTFGIDYFFNSTQNISFLMLFRLGLLIPGHW